MFGAVYKPDADIEPAVANQVTDVFVDPVTAAENCCVAPVRMVAELGFMETATPATTVTVADADFVESATLVAVTV